MSPYCKVCGEYVKFNNMSRHIRRWHPESSDGVNISDSVRTSSSERQTPSIQKAERQSQQTGSSESTTSFEPPTSSLSADYIKDAVLCMLRRVEAVNIPSLSSYLESHFTEIPQAWRMPIIVAAFTAVQKAAATHGAVSYTHLTLPTNREV